MLSAAGDDAAGAMSSDSELQTMSRIPRPLPPRQVFSRSSCTKVGQKSKLLILSEYVNKT